MDSGPALAGSTSSKIWASVVFFSLAVGGCAAYLLPAEAPLVIGCAVAGIGAMGTIWRMRGIESLRDALTPALGR